LNFVEWAEFSDFELPHIEIKIEYIDETVRKFDFYADGDNYKKILEGMDK
jgi:tRNA A37 threonylcarbamoyladenosine biosynthesis protein TsaE